jgi:hypothetical protein
MLVVAPGWLSTTRIGITAGRDFRPDEQEPTVLINQKLAGMFFEGRSPLGATLLADKTRYRIVGVTSDIRAGEVREPVRSAVYFPFGRQPYGSLTLRVADGVREADLARPVRQLIAGSFPGLRVANIRTQKDLILMQTVRERLLAALSLFFGVVALIVAGVGLYGVLSYAVSQRRREIAVRMALGARAGAVVWPFVRESIVMLAIGIAAGLILGLNGYRVIRSLLYEVSGSDPAVLASSILALVLCGLLAAAAPSIRATRVDPVRILRE